MAVAKCLEVCVVQGASRGLGLGLVEALLERGATRVHATCRHPEAASALAELASSHPERLQVHRLDLLDDASIEAAAAAILERDPVLDLVLNVSGVLHGEGLSPEKRLEDLDRRRLLRAFELNAVGPSLVLQALVPGLARDRPAVVASLSARIGSIGDNRRGGWYGYRASKAALNQLHRTFAVELSRRAPQAIAVTLHPGTVETNLTKPFRRSVPEGQLFTVVEAVGKLLTVVDGLEPEDHGGFFDYAGRRIEW